MMTHNSFQSGFHIQTRTLAAVFVVLVAGLLFCVPARAETKPDEWLIGYAFKAIADQNGAQGNFVLFNLVKNDESRTLISSVKYQIAGKTIYGNKNDLDAFQKALLGERYWNATHAIKKFQEVMEATADGAWSSGTWIALADHSKTLANKSFSAGDKIIGMIDLEKTWLTGENSTLLSGLENNQVAKTQMDPRLIAAILDKAAAIEFISYLKDGSSTSRTTVTTTLPSTTQPTSTLATTTIPNHDIISLVRNTSRLENEELQKIARDLSMLKKELSNPVKGSDNFFRFMVITVCLVIAGLLVYLTQSFIKFRRDIFLFNSNDSNQDHDAIQNMKMALDRIEKEAVRHRKVVLHLQETIQKEFRQKETFPPEFQKRLDAMIKGNITSLEHRLHILSSQLEEVVSRDTEAQQSTCTTATVSLSEKQKKLIREIHRLVLNHLVGDEENPYFVELLNRIDLVRRAVTALEHPPAAQNVKEESQVSGDRNTDRGFPRKISFFD